LDPVNYTQGVGISGRLRLVRLNQQDETTAASIAQLVEPYVSGAQAMFGDRAGGANLAGLIWGEELSEATGDRRYADLIVNVADRYQPGVNDGAPPPCDPDFRTEDMFMAGAMLGRAFSITGQERYLDLLVKFLIDTRIQQANGLFWHCRSAPYFWGRGNGFAALGLTETLTYLPESHPAKDALLDMYRRLMDGLVQVQEQSGMLPQILDFPGSYHEFTATCMAGYALARGLGRGWLNSSYQAVLDRAWQGVSERIDGEGNVVDGCVSTGVQGNLKDYLDRPAIFGFDDRSGGMALWFAVEMERLAHERTRG
jgi:rhamnogalacturonyl hydrolase YesR